MSHTAQNAAETARTQNAPRPRGKSTLTAGQMPSWVWLAVLADTGASLLVTAGFGRYRARSGDPQLATEHAEFCIAVPSSPWVMT